MVRLTSLWGSRAVLTPKSLLLKSTPRTNGSTPVFAIAPAGRLLHDGAACRPGHEGHVRRCGYRYVSRRGAASIRRPVIVGQCLHRAILIAPCGAAIARSTGTQLQRDSTAPARRASRLGDDEVDRMDGDDGRVRGRTLTASRSRSGVRS